MKDGDLMNSSQRREALKQVIEQSDRPISASALAKQFAVSRQIVVGDVALLRAQGAMIVATPRGYVMEQKEKQEGIIKTIAVAHHQDGLEEEIYTIVDLGGALLDVIVEHPLYGQLCGKLHIFSRYDADQFFKKLKEEQAKPLSDLTGGLHLHTIQCRDEESFARILSTLKEKGFLYEK